RTANPCTRSTKRSSSAPRWSRPAASWVRSGSRTRDGRSRRRGAPAASSLGCRSRPLSADALDEEADAHLRAPLVEVVAAKPDRDDVDAADVAQRSPRLLQG